MLVPPICRKSAKATEDAMMRIATASPGMNSMMRTTCVATQLEGGHAPNALPQLAAANVNCRILPQDTLAHVLETLKVSSGGRPSTDNGENRRRRGTTIAFAARCDESVHTGDRIRCGRAW